MPDLTLGKTCLIRATHIRVDVVPSRGVRDGELIGRYAHDGAVLGVERAENVGVAAGPGGEVVAQAGGAECEGAGKVGEGVQ